jgi:hypothetical protein
MREIEALYGEKTETRDEGAQKRAYEVLKEQSYQRGGFDSLEFRNLDFIHPFERGLAARVLNLDPQFLSADPEVFRGVLSEKDNLEFLRERLQGFSSRWAELHEFILEKKGWPDRRATEDSEKSLAGWVGTQGGQREVYELLSDEAKALVQPPEKPKTKEEWLQELHEFILAKKRWPDRRATEDSEKSLAGWVRNQGGQREVYKLLSDDAKALVQPAERQTKDERLQELHEFILEKKGWPDRRATEDSEKSLAGWVGTQGGQREVYELLSDEAKALVRPSERQKPKTKGERLPELQDFILKHQRWPTASAAEGLEKSLAGWVATQGGQREVYKLLSDEAKALVQPAEKPKTKDERLQELHEFILEKKGWPKYDAEGLEKKLANWVNKQGGQGEVYELLRPEAKKIIDRLEQSKTKDERLQELHEFILEKKGWPKYDAEGLEKKLANWVNKQGGKAKVYELLSDEAKALVQPPEKRKTKDERQEELHEFILAHQRWPKEGAEGSEKSLALWVNNQGGQPEVYELLSDKAKALVPSPKRKPCQSVLTKLGATSR